MSPSSARRWGSAAVAVVVLGVVLSLDPDVAPTDRYGFDKLLHIGSYGLLALLFARVGLAWRPVAAAGWVWLAAALLSAAVGGGMELAQSLVPGRDGSWRDFLASAIGAFLAALVAAALRRRGLAGGIIGG